MTKYKATLLRFGALFSEKVFYDQDEAMTYVKKFLLSKDPMHQNLTGYVETITLKAVTV